MYITIDDIIGEKTIDLSYPIRSSKEVAVISMLSNDVQYNVMKPRTIIDSIGNQKLILSNTYSGRELLSVLGGMDKLTKFADDDLVMKTNKLRGITEMILNLNILDNADNLEDGTPSNTLLTYHVTADEDFTRFELYDLSLGEYLVNKYAL